MDRDLGTSLNQISAFLSTGMSAGAFAIGAAWLGHSHTAWVGVAMVVVGCSLLTMLERQRTAVTT